MFNRIVMIVDATRGACHEVINDEIHARFARTSGMWFITTRSTKGSIPVNMWSVCHWWTRTWLTTGMTRISTRNKPIVFRTRSLDSKYYLYYFIVWVNLLSCRLLWRTVCGISHRHQNIRGCAVGKYNHQNNYRSKWAFDPAHTVLKVNFLHSYIKIV